MKPRANPGRRAFTLIELLIVLGVIAILSSLALPNMVTSRKSANEASAIASLRQIALAQETYRSRQAVKAYGALSALGGSDLLDSMLVAGQKSGYIFSQPADAPPTADQYVVIATPMAHAGDRHFRVDESGVIRVADGEPATATSPPLQ